MALRDGVEGVVRLGLVPALLAFGLLTAFISAGQAYPRARVAAYGGFWVGVLAAAALALALHGVSLGRLPDHGLAWIVGELLVGVGLGSWTALGYILFRDRAWIAVTLALQSGGSLAMLYLFAVWQEARADIAWVTFGIAPAATLFYTLFRDEPPKPPLARTRARVRAVSDRPDETPNPP